MTVSKEDRAKVFAACEQLVDEAVELLVDLIKIPSENPGYKYDEKLYTDQGYTDLYDEPITRGGETRVNKFLEPLLAEWCDETHIVAADPLRANLVGVINPDAEKSLTLNAHVDTVPVGLHEEWTETGGNPFNATVKDGRVYGRGATDDKGPAACLIKGVEAIRRAGFKLRGQLQVHLTVGEETGEGETIGPGWFVREEPRFKTDACIVAESSAPPHANGICLMSPGVSVLTITVQGKTVHAAMRYRTIRAGYEGEDLGVSAVDKGYKIYRALFELEQEWGLKSDPSGLTPYGFPSIPIGWVKGQPKGIELPFFIADHYEMSMAVWRYWFEDRDEIRAEVNRVIDGVVQSDHWLRENPPIVDWWYDWPAFRIDKDHALTETVAMAYEAAMQEPPRYQSWQPVSDARWYQDLGVPSILIGPGDYRAAHALNEYIDIDHFLPAMKIYALSAMDWLGYE